MNKIDKVEFMFLTFCELMEYFNNSCTNEELEYLIKLIELEVKFYE